MTIAFWHNEYNTGNAEVDQQHQHLFVIVNNLHNAMMFGHGKKVIQETLEQLIKYTVEHFETEERLMRLHKYPDYLEHKNKHDELKQEVTILAAKLKKGDILLNREVLHFLTEWLSHHIKGDDLKMINYLKSKNSAPVGQSRMYAMLK